MGRSCLPGTVLVAFHTFSRSGVAAFMGRCKALLRSYLWFEFSSNTVFEDVEAEQDKVIWRYFGESRHLPQDIV